MLRDSKKAAIILAALLIMQTGGYLLIAREEAPPQARPLAEFPATVGQWNLHRTGVIEDRVQEKLQADDLLTRTYVSAAEGAPASLYIAYFRSQRTGQAPHSPKNCLPGSGWTPSESGMITLPVEGRDAKVNHYVVTRGDSKSVVLYWYQTGDRIVASEYSAKIHLVLDSLRYNRSDTALVRVIVPVVDGEVEAASARAIRFATELLEPLEQFGQFQAMS